MAPLIAEGRPARWCTRGSYGGFIGGTGYFMLGFVYVTPRFLSQFVKVPPLIRWSAFGSDFIRFTFAFSFASSPKSVLRENGLITQQLNGTNKVEKVTWI